MTGPATLWLHLQQWAPSMCARGCCQSLDHCKKNKKRPTAKIIDSPLWTQLPLWVTVEQDLAHKLVRSSLQMRKTIEILNEIRRYKPNSWLETNLGTVWIHGEQYIYRFEYCQFYLHRTKSVILKITIYVLFSSSNCSRLLFGDCRRFKVHKDITTFLKLNKQIVLN